MLDIVCLNCGHSYTVGSFDGIVCPECKQVYYEMNGELNGTSVAGCIIDNREITETDKYLF